MTTAPETRTLNLVMKVSKLCNLRCRYCYEMPELGDPRQMSREQARGLYARVETWLAARDEGDGVQSAVTFIWHGGEPLLVKPAWYWDTLADQAAVFGARPIHNTLQTNLTVLDEERIRLLRDGFQSSVGVSLDAVGDLRVDLAGRSRQQTVLENVSRLQAAGVNRIGFITVLSGANHEAIDEIFDFFQSRAWSFRLLPLFATGDPSQHTGHELPTAAVVVAMKRLIDRWLDHPAPVGVEPVGEIMQYAARHLLGRRDQIRDNRSFPTVWLVNRNGDVYFDGDPFGEPTRALGNLFRQPVTEIVHSANYLRSLDEQEQRMAWSCVRCPYFGACNGMPVAERSFNSFNTGPHGMQECLVEREMITHTLQRLRALSAREGREPRLPRTVPADSSLSITL